jgi:hypothetical protein
MYFSWSFVESILFRFMLFTVCSQIFYFVYVLLFFSTNVFPVPHFTPQHTNILHSRFKASIYFQCCGGRLVFMLLRNIQ